MKNLRNIMWILVSLSIYNCNNDSPQRDTSNDGTSLSQQEQQCSNLSSLKIPRPTAIFYGEDSPEAFSMSTGQKLAVGGLAQKTFQGFIPICTGTIIKSNIALTAAHCVATSSSWYAPQASPDPDDYRFQIGEDLSEPLSTFEIEEILIHPDYRSIQRDGAKYDVAILKLATDTTEEVRGLKPISLNDQELDPWFIGEIVQNVGYGRTETNSNNTERWWTTEEVIDVNEFQITVDGFSESGVCFGDSGGPALYKFPDGIIRVVGTVSNGEESCVDVDNFARVDYSLEWIEDPDVAGTVTGCMDFDYAGECDDGLARWCEDDKIIYEDCLEAGKICGETENQEHRCVDNPCGQITWEGECDTHVLRWCENYEVKEFDCKSCNLTCGYHSADLGNLCVESLILSDLATEEQNR